jgi:hypothetical protein
MSSHSVVKRVRKAVLVAGLALAALPAAPALAVTIGQTGVAPTPCVAGPGVAGDTNYVVPSGGGMVTSFSFQSTAANAGQQVAFLVLRPIGGTDYTVIGTTGAVTLTATNGVQTFAVNIPVQGDDILGVWVANTLTNCARSVGNGGGLRISQGGSPDGSVGSTVSLPAAFPSFDLNLSANLVTKAECKKGGWETFGVFKNQGDCVSFVATKGKNPPSG